MRNQQKCARLGARLVVRAPLAAATRTATVAGLAGRAPTAAGRVRSVARRARPRRRARRGVRRLAQAGGWRATDEAAASRRRLPTSCRTPARGRTHPRRDAASTGRDGGLVRPALDGLVPYEPGKPVETVQRELGLERVVKLASNEGPFGPFPEAIEAIERALPEANRYPDGGCYRLREALAARHGVAFDEVVVAAGADAVIGYVCQAMLDPGDEVVTPLAVVPELRARSAEARRRAPSVSTSPTAASTSTRCSRR